MMKMTRIGRIGLLQSVAAFVAVTLGCAEEAPQATPAKPPALSVNHDNSTARGESMAKVVPESDRAFLEKAEALHTTCAELARLTETNAGTEEIQALGEELLAEHARSIAALREIARLKNVELSAGPSAAQQATIAALAGKIGQAFDDDYLRQALENHKQAILLFSEAAKSARDEDVRIFAERRQGEMKERNAELGGQAVNEIGVVGVKLP
jgi:putative membrane protein